MVTTGWISEEPDAVGPALPVTAMLLARAERRAGPLETALARSRAADVREIRDEAASAPDPDERAAGLVARGYSPGLLNQLSQRLADTTAELEAEETKIEKAARRAEHTHQMHERGQITVAGIIERMRDADDGDQAQVERLRRRADGLRRQIAEAQEMIAPPQRRERDGVEEAASRASRILAEVTRQRQAEDASAARARAQLASERAAFYGARGRRPFASRGGTAEPSCTECRAAGATAEESAEVHRGMPASGQPAGEITRGIEGGIVSIR